MAVLNIRFQILRATLGAEGDSGTIYYLASHLPVPYTNRSVVPGLQNSKLV